MSLDTVNEKQLALLVLVIEFATGCWRWFCFRLSRVLDEAVLTFSNLMALAAGKCSALFRGQCMDALVATTVDFTYQSRGSVLLECVKL